MAKPQTARRIRGAGDDLAKLTGWLIAASVAIPVVASACGVVARSLNLISSPHEARSDADDGAAVVIWLDASRRPVHGEESSA